MKNKKFISHLIAIITIIMWGTTFTSTKVLLEYFTLIEILFCRISLGLIILFLINPKFLKTKSLKYEFMFAFAGLTGILLYFVTENIALTYTTASNVSIIVSSAPFFTGIVNQIFNKKEDKLHINFFIGFVIAMTGIILISVNDTKLHINPFGDFLAITAAIVWAFYSVTSRKIANCGYNTIQSTRKIFTYGLIFVSIAMIVMKGNITITKLSNPICISNLLFLGIGASALGFIGWNFAVKNIGAVKTSIYIYAQPVITVIVSFIFLNEKLTPLSILGTVLTLVGLIISELKLKSKR